MFELYGDIVFQSRLIPLHGKVVMRLLFYQVGSQRPLRQQGICSHILAGDIAAFQYGNRHPDLVGALDRIAVRYG